MIEEARCYIRLRRKGQISSVPITQIIKIILAVIVASTLLAIFIPMIFSTMDSACKLLKSLVERVGFLKMLNDSLNLLQC